jgi:uncharacterized tellurite resistance protein B-like protein
MLDSIKRYVRERILDEAARPEQRDQEHGLRLAAAALMFEVVRADAQVKEEERWAAAPKACAAKYSSPEVR